MSLIGSVWTLREEGRPDIILRFVAGGVLERREPGSRITAGHKWKQYGLKCHLFFCDQPGTYVGYLDGTVMRGKVLEGSREGAAWTALRMTSAPVAGT